MNVESKLPFSDLIEPIVAESSLRLRTATGNCAESVACRHLELHLGTLLSGLAGEALLAEFDTFRSRSTPSTDGCAIYRQFCAAMIGERFERFLQTYPELARLIDLVIDRWIDVSVEFFNRLGRDRAWIQEALRRGTPIRNVVGLQAGISDPHCGGREVFLVSFEGGLRVVYKSRIVAHEAAWNSLLRWISAHGAPNAPPAITVLDSGGYGWTEFVDGSGCSEKGEVAEYYRRTGSLLCLVHLLDGNDCHMENIVATRHGPVLVDAESILRPRICSGESERTRAFAQARAAVEDSVIGTGLLPRSQSGIEGETYDVSGLAGRGGYRIPHLRPLWNRTNRDDMRVEKSYIEATNHRNLPMLGDTVQPAQEWVDEIVQGFCGMWRWLQNQSERMIREALAPMACVPSRLLLRSSTNVRCLIVEVPCRELPARPRTTRPCDRSSQRSSCAPITPAALDCARQAGALGIGESGYPLFPVPAR